MINSAVRLDSHILNLYLLLFIVLPFVVLKYDIMPVSCLCACRSMSSKFIEVLIRKRVGR